MKALSQSGHAVRGAITRGPRIALFAFKIRREVGYKDHPWWEKLELVFYWFLKCELKGRLSKSNTNKRVSCRASHIYIRFFRVIPEWVSRTPSPAPDTEKTENDGKKALSTSTEVNRIDPRITFAPWKLIPIDFPEIEHVDRLEKSRTPKEVTSQAAPRTSIPKHDQYWSLEDTQTDSGPTEFSSLDPETPPKLLTPRKPREKRKLMERAKWKLKEFFWALTQIGLLSRPHQLPEGSSRHKINPFKDFQFSYMGLSSQSILFYFFITAIHKR